MRRLPSFRIVAKDDLKKMFFFGWGMQLFGFIFVSRGNRDKDLSNLTTSVEHHLRDPGPGLTLLLFPEGTDLAKSNVERGIKYAQEKGLPIYHEVLLGRAHVRKCFW